MQTRTKNAALLAGLVLALALALGWVWKTRKASSLRARVFDAVPNGALLVMSADLEVLRKAPVGAPFLRRSREIPGMGKVRDVCGFDPVDSIREIAIAIPAAGDSGDFGLVGAGEAVDDEAILQCAAKVITARGGQAVIAPVGGFRSVRDASLHASGAEIAVSKKGLVLLGAGAYLRAMIDAADGRTDTIRASVAHSALSDQVGAGTIRITVVLTPEQKKMLDAELKDAGAENASTSSVLAAAIGATIEQKVKLHGVITCADEAAAALLAKRLTAVRDERAADVGARLIGVGALLEKINIEAVDETIHARAEIPSEDAAAVLERVLTLRGMRHPMPPPDATPLPDGTPGPR